MESTFDYARLRRETNGRLAVEDMQLLERACAACAARRILEIGSADGGSSVILGRQSAARDGHLWCIEPRPRQRMVDTMAAYGLADRYTLLAAASPWLPVPLLTQLPWAEGLDLLFIDGRHDVRWCLVDYHYFEPLVRPGGVIVFHDTSGTCREDRAQPAFGRPGYVPLVRRAIDLILSTDSLCQIDASTAPEGGALAYRKGGVA
jgi:predicted O-methyltransferase YrrM